MAPAGLTGASGIQSSRTRNPSTSSTPSRSSPWTWRNIAMTVALALVLKDSTFAAPAPLLQQQQEQNIPALVRRDVSYVTASAPLIEVTFQTQDTPYIEHLNLDECFSNFKLPLSGPNPDIPVRNYTNIIATDAEVGLNFFLDDQCNEFDFAIQSQVLSWVGSFASVRYVGQFLDAKPGLYERELSPTALPDQDPDGKNHTGPVSLPTSSSVSSALPTSSVTTTSVSSSASATTTAAEITTATSTPTSTETPVPSGTHTAGFAVSSGIVGIVAFAGVIGACFLGYKKFIAGGAAGGLLKGNNRGGGGDGRFMSLREDYDDEIVAENGPHSSALMQSRVGVSFEDERFDGQPTGSGAGMYSDDDEDDERVELGAYPQNPTAPTQYRPEPGTMPQNARG
ncbi:hypothetical protein BGZ83_008182 [Gryganskiella cystojenkinii]|nr:hypothetical protein BGZ83_008182 [Gryganskiella cystojenkinii]